MKQEEEIEEAMENSIRKTEHISPIKVNEDEIEPWIILFEKKGKLHVMANQAKILRILNNKAIIMGAIDILIVDKHKELLNKLATEEQEREKDIKEQFGGTESERKIREHRTTGSDNPKSGQGGTSSSPGRFI